MVRFPVILLFFSVVLAPVCGAGNLADLQSRREKLAQELETLPRPLAGPAGGTLGYASELITKEIGKTMPKWIEIDLGEIFTIDAIALVPGWMIGADRSEKTHGFPLDFFIEVDTSPNVEDRERIFESGPDYPDPGRHPLWIGFEARQVRYIRVTAEALSANFLGFSEILVFAGRRNVALGATVNALDTLLENENWRNEYLTDGFTPLGLPIETFSHRRNGFRSTALSTRNMQVRVELEWENTVSISSIALVPSLIIPNLMAIGRWGQGFPAAFRIEAFSGDTTGEWTTLFNYPPDGERPFPNPGNVAWHQAFPEIETNRLRLVVTRHRFDPVGQTIYFSLAEIQVFNDKGENVALNAKVSATHPATKDDSWSGAAWRQEALVDGCAGDGKLAPMRDWLVQLDRRRQVLKQLDEVDAAILVAQTKSSERRRWLVTTGAIIFISALAGVGGMIWRSRNREANRLRERIANDLHDEVGSTLGSIALNAEVLSRRLNDDPLGERLQQMGEKAREASQTMRDLVWVVDHRTDDSVNLLERLRTTAAELLGEKAHRFVVPDPFPKVSLSPEQKRHLLLFLKESLHNVLRHSGAESTVIYFSPNREEWYLAVEDDGRGFEFDVEDEEQLDRLRSRARRLGGILEVQTNPGEGTRIELRVPKKGGRSTNV